MSLASPSSLLRRLKKFLKGSPHRYLKEVSGVIHVGAHRGQERDRYAQHDLDVVWLEPNPDLFRELEANLAGFPRQRAYRHLVTDQDDKEVVFHIANNGGASSSILELKRVRDIWPNLGYSSELLLKSITLPSFLAREGIDPAPYQALVLDTQGSELMILKGAESLLGGFRYIETEAADFDAYEGCCTVEDLRAFLRARGFRECARKRVAGEKGVGKYYTLVFRRG